MLTLYFVMYMAAGVCFGLAIGRTTRQISFLALGLLLWELVDTIRLFQNL